MIDSAQTGARCREKQRRKRFVKAFQWKKQKDSHGCAVRRVWKGCGNGANRGARSVNPQFSDANAGQRGYNRRHFPAGDAARMQGTTPSLQINVADAFSSCDEKKRAKTRAIKRGEHSSNVVQGRSFPFLSFANFHSIWESAFYSADKFFNFFDNNYILAGWSMIYVEIFVIVK